MVFFFFFFFFFSSVHKPNGGKISLMCALPYKPKWCFFFFFWKIKRRQKTGPPPQKKKTKKKTLFLKHGWPRSLDADKRSSCVQHFQTHLVRADQGVFVVSCQLVQSNAVWDYFCLCVAGRVGWNTLQCRCGRPEKEISTCCSETGENFWIELLRINLLELFETAGHFVYTTELVVTSMTPYLNTQN